MTENGDDNGPILRGAARGRSMYSPTMFALLFGLEELRVGRHYLRDKDRHRVGSLWVQSWWRVEIMPSFHIPSVLGVVTTVGEEFRGNRAADWIKAAFTADQQSRVIPLDMDSVAPLLNNFDLFRPGGGLSLDGIAYRVVFETMELGGTLAFGNPSQGSLVALERGLLQLAYEVAMRSANKELLTATDTWKQYVGDR